MDIPVNTQVVTSPTIKTTFMDLPPEILSMISACLTQSDRTVGVRVSRDWFRWLIDDLWHTVEITAAVSFPSRPSNYFRFKAACEANDDDDSGGNSEGSRTLATLHRNLGRIRVLNVHHANTLALLSRIIEEDNHHIKGEGMTNYPQPFHSLLEFSASFDQEPVEPHSPQPPGFRPQIPHSTPPPGFRPQVPLSLPPEPTRAVLSEFQAQYLVQLQQSVNLKPFLQIISQCQTLRRCAITIFLHSEKWAPEDQALLLASIPQSLEKLEFQSFGTPDLRHHRPERAEAKTAVILAQISGAPFLAPNPVLLLRLKALSLSGMTMDMDVFLAFLERCPNLDELQVDEVATERPLIRILTEGPKNEKGWRTLGFRSVYSGDITRAVVKALLDHCTARLENLRIYVCGSTFRSEDIQRLLCAAPKLKRFDMIGRIHDYATDRHCLLAKDIVQSSKAGENWACLDLESFKCLIGGISRPDLLSKIDARDSTGELQDFGSQKTQEGSRELQRKVLAQFAQLRKLREISLGPDLEVMTQDCFDDCCSSPHVLEYFEQSDPAQQYDCLSLTLEDGLDQLRDLKSLRRLNIDKVSHRMGDKEHEWIQRHWPEYGREYRETFWTERGHHASMSLQATGRHKQLSKDLYLFDWW